MTHWPTRSTMRLPTPSRSMANNSTAIPGRPSGVSSTASARSIAASHLQPMTEVAKPVAERAASCAQASLAAVMSSRAKRIGNASANVSATSVAPSV